MEKALQWSDEMRVLLKVHGFVQGVGYRDYVRRMAEHHNVKGYVKNLEDGSVEILADASEHALKEFMKDIEVRTYHGPEVHHIESVEREASGERLDSFSVL